MREPTTTAPRAPEHPDGTTADGLARPMPRFWPSGLVFVAIPFVLSKIPGAVTFAVNPNAAEDIGLTEVPVPAWLFITVWAVIYPCMGVAGWQVWRHCVTQGADAVVPLVVLSVGLLQTFSFWLTDSLRTTAIVDATGVLLALTTWCVFARYSRSAARWLVPWAAWMPITLAIKIAALTGALTA